MERALHRIFAKFKGLEGRLDEAFELLDHVHEHVKVLKHQGEQIMATLTEYADILASINSETNRIAAVIEALVAQQGQPGLTEAEENSIRDQFQAAADALKLVGANPPTP